MATNTTKRTVATSSSKASNKSKATKKGLLGRSFNLQSRKVQFVVFILVVAILGGGWFTYKSFAATASWTYSISNNNLTGTLQRPGEKCSISPYNEPQKLTHMHFLNC